MKQIFFSLSLVLLTVSCTSNKPQEVKDQDQPVTVELKQEPVTLNPVENYFSVLKPTEKTELVLDSVDFSKDFNPAATMKNKPTSVDFSKEKVGAIILPQTDLETSINIDSAYVINETLNVVYSIKQGTEKRSFTIVPCTLFSFNKDLSKNNVVFKENK